MPNYPPTPVIHTKVASVAHRFEDVPRRNTGSGDDKYQSWLHWLFAQISTQWTLWKMLGYSEIAFLLKLVSGYANASLIIPFMALVGSLDWTQAVLGVSKQRPHCSRSPIAVVPSNGIEVDLARLCSLSRQSEVGKICSSYIRGRHGGTLSTVNYKFQKQNIEEELVGSFCICTENMTSWDLACRWNVRQQFSDSR